MYRTATSIVKEISAYLNACQSAAKDDSVFEQFKSSSDYRYVLEHVTEDQGREYLEFLKQHKPSYLKEPVFTNFKGNDSLGSPIKYDYENGISVSPTTLRYMKVLSDLEKYFDLEKVDNFAEIGGGYGGQSFIMSCLYSFKRYDIYDLEEVCPLINKYVRKMEVPNVKAVYIDENSSNLPTYDFVMSNYAFSELVEDEQDMYLEKVIFPSKMGYLTCNYIYTEMQKDNYVMGYAKEDLVRIMKNQGFQVEIFEEVPNTHKNNYILIYKR